MAKPKTKAPSGLSATRDNLRFYFSWKVSDNDYNLGQQVSWRIYTDKRWSKWSPVKNVDVDTTTYCVSLNAKDYYPNKNAFLYAVQFNVRGRRSDQVDGNKRTEYDWSPWSAKCDYQVYGPRNASAIEELDNEADNRTTFTWNADVSDTEDNNPFYNTEWQSILVKNCNQTDGSKLKWNNKTLGWQTGSGNRNSSKTFTEETELLAQDSYTRWFRIRCRGAGGNGWTQSARGTGCSYWRYVKHVYALPKTPKINKATKEGSMNWIRVNWTADTDAAHPIDLTTVGYAIGIPRSGLALPENPSWNDVHSFIDTGGKDECSFLIPDIAIQQDNLVWARVSVIHDRRSRFVAARVMEGKNTFNKGLKTPSNLTAEVISQTTTLKRVRINVTHESEVPDSKIAVIFRRSGQKDIIVGIMLHSETTKEMDCPTWNTTDNPQPAFVVYEFQGSHESHIPSDTGKDYTYYTVKPNLTSAELKTGGAVPIAPTNFRAESTERSGEVLLRWSWSWSSASFTELSWSTNPNAWESISQPQTYVVDNLNSAKWYVDGLEPGVVYYFRARFGRRAGEDVFYGPYCKAINYTLDLDPDTIEKPMLVLSDGVVPLDKTFKASWTIAASDNSTQTNASICTVDMTDPDNPVYNSPFKTFTTEQSFDIDPSLFNWQKGTIYYLAVKVKTTSKMESEWSSPVAIAIADPINCEIEDTSLTDVTIGGGRFGTEIIHDVTYSVDSNGYPVYLTVESDAPTTGTVETTYGEGGGTVEEYAEIEYVDVYDSSTQVLNSIYYDNTYQSVEINKDESITITRNLDSNWGDFKVYIGWRESKYTSSVRRTEYIPIEIGTPKTVTINGDYRSPDSNYVVFDFSYDGDDTFVITYSDESSRYGSILFNSLGFSYIKNYNVYNPVDDKGERIQDVLSVYSHEEYITKDILSLTQMPMTIRVRGADEASTTSISIERTHDYHVNRPDESVFNGYEGEAVYVYSQNGDAEITINNEDLVGSLDDGAEYKLTAIVADKFGQTATEELVFEVHWEHQALMPQAEVEILPEQGVAILGPIGPTGTTGTDVCDIYRLSVDKPELVYENAVFDSVYVDPYPTIGESGGYRFVFKTENNDYITANNVIAWLDISTEFNTLNHIIEFDGRRVNLMYNVDLSSTWSKDFQETHYLGGSVQGDWNPAVSRTGSVNGVSIIATDQETIEAMRRLAVYSGVCHVRTRDGSSYDANINVSESRGHEATDLVAEFALSINRVDPETTAGMTYEDWIETQETQPTITNTYLAGAIENSSAGE